MADLIQIENLTYTYPDAPDQGGETLHDINLNIQEGEYIAVLGANGSGKSTLARMMNALLIPDSGKVHIGGLDTSQAENIPQIRRLIGMVFQYPEEQIFSSTIEEDVAFGLENYGWEYQAMHRRVQEVLETLNLWSLRKRPSYLLSAGQTQRLALAGVLALQPRCIIFDEATSMLDPIGRELILRQMQELQQAGNTIIHITHSMEEAAKASRAVVLLNGSLVFDGHPAVLFSGAYDLSAWKLEYPLALQLVQVLRSAAVPVPEKISRIDDLADWLSKGNYSFRKPDVPRRIAPLEIEVRDLQHIYLQGTPFETMALSHTDLQVAQSSCHGLIGVTGSGKSTLLQHLNGILRPQSGSVRVGSYLTADPNLPLKELVKYAGLVMQNPEVQFFEEFVGDEIAFGPRTVGINESIATRVQWAMAQVELDFERFKDRRLYTLSGGEKRKVALASLLALKPQVLLLDEPTAGLDPSTHREVLRVFKRMMKEGTTMVVSSHNMEDVAELCDHITVMAQGESITHGETGEILGDVRQMERLQMIAPVAARVASALVFPDGFTSSGIASMQDLAGSLQEVSPE